MRDITTMLSSSMMMYPSNYLVLNVKITINVNGIKW